MATEDGLPDNPARDRATVALVDAKLDGLHQLTKAGFSDIQRQLDAVAGLPVLVTKLQSDLTALEQRERLADEAMGHRVTALENGVSSDRDYRRIHLPTLLLAAVVALGTIVGLITQLH